MIDPQVWAAEQFGKVALGDLRRTARLVRMAASAATAPAGTVTEVFKGDAERQGAYDFLENDLITAEALERGAGEAVAARLAHEANAYVVLDGTTLSLSDFYGKRGLGKIGNYGADGAGVKVITALAMSESAVPIGPLKQVMWSRPRERPARPRTQSRPISEKETRHWIDAIETSSARMAQAATKLTFIIDREADVDAVLVALSEKGHCFVIRGRNRLGRKTDVVATLREHLAQTASLGTYELEIHGRGRPFRSARTATIEVRAVDLVLEIKHPTKKRVSLAVSVINAREISELPGSEEAVDWLLITNARVSTFRDAKSVIATYELRWSIEEFHKTWKSGGCRIEESQLRGEQAVMKWALILAAVACRIERLKILARATPDASADVEFSELELHTLILLKRRQKKKSEFISDKTPTIAQATMWLAELGGYTGKSSGGPPGAIVLSRGLFRLRAGVDAISAFLDSEMG